MVSFMRGRKVCAVCVYFHFPIIVETAGQHGSLFALSTCGGNLSAQDSIKSDNSAIVRFVLQVVEHFKDYFSRSVFPPEDLVARRRRNNKKKNGEKKSTSALLELSCPMLVQRRYKNEDFTLSLLFHCFINRNCTLCKGTIEGCPVLYVLLQNVGH